jgi:hypothetical protein
VKEYVKVSDYFEGQPNSPRSGLNLETVLLVPLLSEGDEAEYRASLVSSLQSSPSQMFAPIANGATVSDVEVRVFPGMPDEPGQPSLMRPLSFGYWKEFFEDTGDGGESPGGEEEVTPIVRFTIHFFAGTRENVRELGERLLDFLANEAGTAPPFLQHCFIFLGL